MIADTSVSTDGPVILLFRNDLRLRDNRAFAAAAASGRRILPLLVLDEDSWGPRAPGAAKQWWLHQSIRSLQTDIHALGGALAIRLGPLDRVIDSICRTTGAVSVFWNRRYDPAEVAIDAAMKARLRQSGLGAESFEGHLLHEPSRLLTGHGGPYRVYGAFRRTLANGPDPRDPVDAPKNMAWLIEAPGEKLPASHPLRAAPDWAKAFASEWRPGENGAHARLESLINEKLNSYNEGRDFMAQDFTSKLSPHLAHGEITPYQILSRVRTVHSVGQTAGAAKLRAELIWREFCHHLKFHHADLHEKNYDSRFNNFPWRSDDDQLRSWRKGLTGYPIVDAGMRQLWQTGWMHNRVRMIVASFLTKHLLIDWREGERWFWNTLVDADCASNPANWQWVAGSGADAAPYFRIFNPVLQGQKFDPDGEYVRRFVPELARLGGRAIHAPWTAPTADLAAAGVTLGHNYPFPIVDHSMARSRALAAFAAIKGAL